MIKDSVLELQTEHLYTTCNQELTLSKIKVSISIVVLTVLRENTIPSLQPGKNTQPTATGTEGRFSSKRAFTTEPLCEISDLLISSELVLPLMNGLQVHEMKSSFNTFTTPHKSLHS